MPLATITNEVMRHLPAALRPNPHNLDEHVMQLATDGWTATDIVDAVIADRPREPGHVVAQIRRLTNQPAPHQPTSNHNNLGPCTTGCSYGWFDPPEGNRTIPCPSCRPDTTRRLALREQARGRGAPTAHLGPTMTDNTQPTPHTWPVTHD